MCTRASVFACAGPRHPLRYAPQGRPHGGRPRRPLGRRRRRPKVVPVRRRLRRRPVRQPGHLLRLLIRPIAGWPARSPRPGPALSTSQRGPRPKNWSPPAAGRADGPGHRRMRCCTARWTCRSPGPRRTWAAGGICEKHQINIFQNKNSLQNSGSSATLV